MGTEDKLTPGALESPSSTWLSWLAMMARGPEDELWTFELATRTLRTHHFDEFGGAHEQVLYDMPATASEQAIAHPDSLADFCALFDGMLAGHDHGSANVLLRSRAHAGYAWCELTYRMQYDGLGTALRAIGVRRGLDGDGPGRLPDELVPDCLYPHLLRVSVADLASGAAESLMCRPGGQRRLVRDVSLSEVAGDVSELLLTPREAAAYRALLDPASLARLHDEGRHWAVGRFRMLDEGTVRPVRVAVNVRRDAFGGLVALVYTSLCDQRTGWESSAEASVMRDESTQLYQRSYAHVAGRSILAACPRGSLAAVSVVRAVELEPMSPRTMRDLATAISVFLDTDCVTYSHDERSVGAFFPSAGSEDALLRRLSEALEAARESLGDAGGTGPSPLEGVRLVAETVCAPADRLELARAADQARAACERHEPGAGDVVGRPVPQHGAPEAEKDAPSVTLDDLAPDELRAFAGIASSMLGAGSSLQAINAALRGLGDHYAARRAYVVMVTSDDGLLTIPFEWADAQSVGIGARLSNSPASHFPFISRHMDSREPVFVSRERTLARTDGAPVDPWRFCLVPVSRTSERFMGVCIDCPTRHLDEWNLATCVSRRVLDEWRALSRDRRGARPDSWDELGEMPGPDELDEMLGRPGAQEWSSLGAFVVGVARPEELVARSGLTHALEVCSHIRATLAQCFDELPAFRLGDAEFVALAPNSGYRSFVHRCARARAAIVAAHPGEARLGSAWGDGAEDSWGVVEEARLISQRDTGAAAGEPPHVEAPPARRPEGPTTLPDALDRDFTVYLQPKIDMRTGELVGAESLARVMGNDGQARSPVREVERLERSGGVAALDYFVFDATLSLMSSWRERGYGDLAVSSNFSRSTLLAPTSLASVLAILSRYPDVPVGLVEMEITETAIDLGATTLRELVGRFRSLGLRVALDDFGSSYSNVSALANVRFDTVKLDRGLVSGVPDNPVSCALVRNIAQICADQGMGCVAEGVESAEQAEALVREGCHCCQGFYYDRPLPARAFEQKYLVGRRDAAGAATPCPTPGCR